MSAIQATPIAKAENCCSWLQTDLSGEEVDGYARRNDRRRLGEELSELD
jgi:hypothetical protein